MVNPTLIDGLLGQLSPFFIRIVSHCFTFCACGGNPRYPRNPREYGGGRLQPLHFVQGQVFLQVGGHVVLEGSLRFVMVGTSFLSHTRLPPAPGGTAALSIPFSHSV